MHGEREMEGGKSCMWKRWKEGKNVERERDGKRTWKKGKMEGGGDGNKGRVGK